MRVRAKETSFMNGTDEQWIAKDREYDLIISKYKFINDWGDEHGVAANILDDYFEVIECEYCDEASMKSIYYNKEEEILEIYIEPDKTLSVSRPYGGNGANVKINYCPMCGRPFS